jgi:protein phosphatase
MSFAFRFVIQSNVGVIRKSNEDCGLASTKLIAVADGMGGHAAGEVASSTVIQTFKEQLETLPDSPEEFKNWLVSTTNQAHASIGDQIAADSEKRGMGTTFSTITVLEDKIGVGHIGDSRIYRLRDGNFQQISIDHTYVQSLVDSGEITQAEAATHPRRNLLIRAIDGIHDVAMDIDLLDAKVGDRFLLCSDGLSGVVSDNEIANQLSKTDLTTTVGLLIEQALSAGAPDNVTVAVCEVVEDDVQINKSITPIVVGAFEVNENPIEVHNSSNKRVAFKVAALILIALSIVGISNSWLNSQWFVASSNGNVAIFQGINQKLGPISFGRLSVETQLPVSTLTQNDLDAISHGVSTTNQNSGLILIQEMWSRSTICELATAGCKP